jgi:hypothetical protein
MRIMQRHIPRKNQAVPHLFVNPLAGNAQSYSTYDAYRQPAHNAFYANPSRYGGEINVHQTTFMQRFAAMSASAYNRTIEIQAAHTRFQSMGDYLQPSLYSGVGRQNDKMGLAKNNNAINMVSANDNNAINQRSTAQKLVFGKSQLMLPSFCPK